VLRVSDLMDAQGVMQDELGYANKRVLPRDTLIRVDSESVEHANVTHLHQLLSGDLHSTVELCFHRAHDGEPDGTIPYVRADFSAHDDFTDLEVVLCVPAVAGADLANAEQLKGRLAVTRRGGCSFQAKTERVELAGARGLVIVNTDDALFTAASSGFSAGIPVAMIRAKDEAALLAAGNSSCLRPSTGGEFSVKVKRHAARSLMGGGSSTDDTAALRAQVKELEKAKADAEISINQCAMELHQAKQEYNTLKRAAEARADAEVCVDQLKTELSEEKKESSKWRRAVEELRESDRIRAAVFEVKQRSFEEERDQLQLGLRKNAAELEMSKKECQALRNSVEQLSCDLSVVVTSLSEPRERE
jgi:hypothetical protein